jgi:hypothetical protein
MDKEYITEKLDMILMNHFDVGRFMVDPPEYSLLKEEYLETMDFIKIFKKELEG